MDMMRAYNCIESWNLNRPYARANHRRAESGCALFHYPAARRNVRGPIEDNDLMKLGKRRTTLGVMVAIICLLPFSYAGAQTEPQMAEDVWPGIDLLRGMPADEFWDIMGCLPLP